jgi:ribonuclease HII
VKRRVVGIDEAGRGCVFGDLVVAGYYVEALDELALRAAGADDSKRIPADRRGSVRAALAGMGRAVVRRITPQRIDTGNLNALEEEAIVELLVELRPDHVVIDALGHPSTLRATAERLLSALPGDLRPEITIEPKADRNHAVVGAASVFAKTLRDELLAAHAAEHGELGSGYPGDPKTKAWLQGWSRSRRPWPAFVRTKWATVTELQQGALF